MAGHSLDNEFRPYPDEDIGEDWSLLMFLLIIISTFMQVLAETSIPFASYAVKQACPYLRMPRTSLAWWCRTPIVIQKATLLCLPNRWVETRMPR